MNGLLAKRWNLENRPGLEAANLQENIVCSKKGSVARQIKKVSLLGLTRFQRGKCTWDYNGKLLNEGLKITRGEGVESNEWLQTVANLGCLDVAAMLSARNCREKNHFYGGKSTRLQLAGQPPPFKNVQVCRSICNLDDRLLGRDLFPVLSPRRNFSKFQVGFQSR